MVLVLPFAAPCVATGSATAGRDAMTAWSWSDFDRRRLRRGPEIAVIALVTFFLSTQMFFQPNLLDFWTPADVAVAWLQYLAELSILALAMGLAYAAVDAVWRRVGGGAQWVRLAAMAVALYVTALLYELAAAALRNRLAVAPDVSFALVTALRWAVVGFYAVLVQTLWKRVRQADAQALAAEAGADHLVRERLQLRLQLLQAQIEPHFLFNTLANVRRLYRTDLNRGSQMMASLKRYLEAALPGVRRDDATLADELALVRSYLELISVRMGSRLAFDVSDESGQGGAPFPSMIVLTLVENAIKHGVEPSPHGGRVTVRALARDGGGLEVAVADDGVGLGGAQSSGTGVGLANIRSQLQSFYGAGARLVVAAATPGVVARIVIARARP
jgi:signal transduction histidine kinase